MIYHLLYYLRDSFTHRVGFYAYQNVAFRSVAAILTSLAIALVIGPKIIRWLMRKKIGDRPEFHHATLNESYPDVRRKYEHCSDREQQR